MKHYDDNFAHDYLPSFELQPNYIHNLPEVKIAPRNYRKDSIENREVYAKIFDFSKPGISVVSTDGGVGLGLTELINIFRFM